MRLLAVDQGSIALGLAAFEGRELVPGSARRLRGRGEGWHQRMRSIARQLQEHLAGEWRPDVIAIEGVALQRGPRANPRTLAIMGSTRGYLMRVFEELAPAARVIEINPQRTKSAVGAPRARKLAKRHIGWAAEAFTGEAHLPEDAADAVAIGLAALEQLRAEEFAALVREEREGREGQG